MVLRTARLCQATGGVTPYSWSVVSGSLPTGLSLGSSSGTISGTPSASGTSNFTVRVTDSQGTPDTDDQALSITIASAPANLVITTSSLPAGQVGNSYNQTVQATGGVTPYSWSVVSGSSSCGFEHRFFERDHFRYADGIWYVELHRPGDGFSGDA